MALIVGIDVGRKSPHDAVILRRETGLEAGRSFRFTSSPKGLARLFRRIDQVRQDDEPVDLVMDSPAKAWIPLAAALMTLGLPGAQDPPGRAPEEQD